MFETNNPFGAMYGNYQPYQQQMPTVTQPQPYPQVNNYSQQPIYSRQPNYAQQNTPQQPQPQQVTASQKMFSIQAVTSIEEARAAIIIEPETIYVFTDFANGKIYTKQLNMNDGTSIFRTYKIDNPAPVQTIPIAEPAIEYAPLSEVEALKSEIENLKKLLAVPATKIKAEAKVDAKEEK